MNLVLIGMPGAGKSTVGVLLAKALYCDFLDTDVYIQVREGRKLQDIIDHDGMKAFRETEERNILTTRCENSVIATGGSVVYSTAAMNHLRKGGYIVHLSLPLDQLEKRITNMGSRGLVIEPGQTLADLFRERMPLYRQYADATVECEGLTHDETVLRVLDTIAGLWDL